MQKSHMRSFLRFFSTCISKDVFLFALDRSSVCDDSGERDEKLPKMIALVPEPTLQTEGESLNRHALPGVSADTAFLAICSIYAELVYL